MRITFGWNLENARKPDTGILLRTDKSIEILRSRFVLISFDTSNPIKLFLVPLNAQQFATNKHGRFLILIYQYTFQPELFAKNGFSSVQTVYRCVQIPTEITHLCPVLALNLSRCFQFQRNLPDYIMLTIVHSKSRFKRYFFFFFFMCLN